MGQCGAPKNKKKNNNNINSNNNNSNTNIKFDNNNNNANDNNSESNIRIENNNNNSYTNINSHTNNDFHTNDGVNNGNTSISDKNKNTSNKSFDNNDDIKYNNYIEKINEDNDKVNESHKPDEKLIDDDHKSKENSQKEDDNKSDNEVTNFPKKSIIKIEKIENDKSIPNLTEELTLYDLIIYCNSLEKIKNNGWYYRMSKDFEKKKNEKVTCIGIIGDANAGKSYILNKLTDLGNTEKYSGIDIKTEGLSCKYHRFPNDKNWYLLFDTEGNSEPLIKNEKDKKKYRNLQEEIQFVSEKAEDMKKSEKFLSKFIINNSHIIIYVINTLTLETQQTIFELKYEATKFYVIHNLINFYDKESIENYIENTLRKSIPNNLKKIFYTEFDEKENNGYYYFIESLKDDNDNTEKQIIHLIMGNNENVTETKEVRKFFNEKTFKFIKKNITTGNDLFENFDIIENLKEELKLELNFAKDNIENIINIDGKYGKIKYNNTISRKNTNKGQPNKNDNLYNYVPEFSYYLEGKKFLYIIFEVPGKEDKDLKFNYKNKRGKYIFYIEGKKINKYDKQKDEFFFFNIELNQKKHGIKIKPGSVGEINFAKGIYTIKYQIEDKKKNFILKEEK